MLVAFLLLPSLFLSMVPAAPVRAHPALVALANDSPDLPVRVIAQKSGDAPSAALVSARNGRLLADLPLINAFGAEMTAAAAVALAADPAIAWVSPDGPVASSQSGDSVSFQSWATELAPNSANVMVGQEDFEDIPLFAGDTIWFNSIAKVESLDESPVTVRIFDSAIHFVAGGVDYKVEVPEGMITVSPTATSATTHFDEAGNTWHTIIPFDYEKETFLTGVPFTIPVDMPDRIRDVTWAARFTSDRPDLDFKVQWKWGAAVYDQFNEDMNQLGIKPVKADDLSAFSNDHMAGTPEHYTPFLLPGAHSKEADDYTGKLSGGDVDLGFYLFEHIADDGFGPDGLYGQATRMVESFTGFEIEVIPGYTINQVEVMVHVYTALPPDKDLKLHIAVGEDSKEVKLSQQRLVAVTGSQNAATLYLDVTDIRAWTWSDFFDGVTLTIDQNDFNEEHIVYYDAVGFRITSVPGSVEVNAELPEPEAGEAIDIGNLTNAYNLAVRAPEVWNAAPTYLQGQGVTVAIVDSGVGKNDDIKGRRFLDVNFNRDHHDSKDYYGHGTFVASIVAGDGRHSKGAVMGIAPKANLINVRISDDQGMSTELDVIEALQWVNDNREAYNIRVVNLSVNATVPQPYHTSPLSAAVEILWFNGVVVVVSAGNNGTGNDNGILYPPANDPFVITVGATDDQGTPTIADDTLASFSAYGITESGFAKPDIVAPGTDIIAYLKGNDKMAVGRDHPSHVIDRDYFRMSGTSFSAPMVTGAVAILLQDEPHLTPDQVKYRLLATAAPFAGPEPGSAGAGYLDIYAAVHGTTTESANTGLAASQLLTTGSAPIDSSVAWNSVAWNSVAWNSVAWNSVAWNSVAWNSVAWNSVSWDD